MLLTTIYDNNYVWIDDDDDYARTVLGPRGDEIRK